MPAHPLIRPLDPVTDLSRVVTFYADAPDYWLMAEGRAPDQQKARAFFTDGPPGCDADKSHRLGLFLGKRLSGVAELSFGFPNPQDAYLGLLMLGPWARNAGLGKVFLEHIEGLACEAAAPALYLAVLAPNTKGRAFWAREGFIDTGLSGVTRAGAREMILHRLRKPL